MSDKEEKVQKKKPEDDVVTIRDFKAMIVGMDMIMGDDWTPDERQWKRIRAKIDALIETAERPMQAVARTSNVSEDHLVRSFPQVPAAEGVPIGQAAPAGQSVLAPQPRMPAPVSPNLNAPVADGREKVKTPDIDSTSGYKSTFV